MTRTIPLLRPDGRLLVAESTLWLNPNTVVLGCRYCTNAPGIAQLRARFEPHSINVVAVDLPNDAGPPAYLHPMSLINMPDDATVPVAFSAGAVRAVARRARHALIAAPEDEFDTQGHNILALAPRLVLMVEGNLKPIACVQNAGCEVIMCPGEEIFKKREGGPICLMRPILRRD